MVPVKLAMSDSVGSPHQIWDWCACRTWPVLLSWLSQFNPSYTTILYARKYSL